ncbi:UNVERIFIED_ORG: endonuclease YncB(thermonuclease family) [Rhizobium etli]
MLTQQQVVHYRNRIDTVLSGGTLTDWQRQFLVDIRDKLGRYGARTRLSEKQLTMLDRLAGPPPQSNLQVVVTNSRSEPSRSQPLGEDTQRSYRGGSRLGRPFRVRNPLRPRNFLRPPRAIRSFSLARTRMMLIAFACVMVVGLVGSFLGGADGTARVSSYRADVAEPDLNRSSASSSFTVTDGDTIRLGDGTRVRLVGFNTPEKFEPQCSNEGILGNRASERLKELVATASSMDVQLVRCSCKPGTEGTKKCNYGRSCGRLSLDGRDVGKTLISEGLAVPFVCGATGCPPTPRPWCG